jgi:hypothetical protein
MGGAVDDTLVLLSTPNTSFKLGQDQHWILTPTPRLEFKVGV